MTYPAYLDTDGVWSDKAGVHGIPVFLVVDREGKLAYRHAGKLTDGSAPFSRLEAALDQALARKL